MLEQDADEDELLRGLEENSRYLQFRREMGL